MVLQLIKQVIAKLGAKRIYLSDNNVKLEAIVTPMQPDGRMVAKSKAYPVYYTA